MVNLAVSITGGNHKGDRIENDFYATPKECVTSFLEQEYQYLTNKKIYEPCCGDGAISKILIENNLDVYSSDLIDRNYGDTLDFLKVTSTDCNAIITNPPFNIAEDIIIHALEELKVEYLALLLKSQYWHSKRRMTLFEKYPPAIIYAMTWRPDFLKKGSPTMDCQWTVWRKNDGNTLFKPIRKKV